MYMSLRALKSIIVIRYTKGAIQSILKVILDRNTNQRNRAEMLGSKASLTTTRFGVQGQNTHGP